MAPSFTSTLTPRLSLITSIYLVISFIPGTKAAVSEGGLCARIDEASAWNGLDDVTGDDYSKSHFTPYYVPIGSISLDDADPLINYSPDGAWAMARHPALVDRTMHTTSQSNATVEFVFVGIGQ